VLVLVLVLDRHSQHAAQASGRVSGQLQTIDVDARCVHALISLQLQRAAGFSLSRVLVSGLSASPAALFRPAGAVLYACVCYSALAS
jgi:hypothetical protein